MTEKRSLIDELHVAARRNFPRRRVIVHGYNDLWQVDVVKMRPYTRCNRGYHYILTVIDVLSKHAWAVSLKVKIGNEVTKAIAKIIRDDGRCPKNLQTDKGKEFYNSNVQKLLKKHNINHYIFWIDMLPRLVSDYNARKHRTIGMRPIDVTSAIADRLLITVYNHIKIAAPARFKVGDSVCVSKFKTIFKKGYTSNWTTEVFKIIKVQQTNPVTYLLEDTRGKPIVGGFYEYELHRVANPDMYLVEKVLREKGNEVYVKWLGFDNSHNSWIHKDNLRNDPSPSQSADSRLTRAGTRERAKSPGGRILALSSFFLIPGEFIPYVTITKTSPSEETTGGKTTTEKSRGPETGGAEPASASGQWKKAAATPAKGFSGARAPG
ncbi:uncharacterized protein [Mycetomoellerius zeteki]|uniref:uncharacterized protein n=1 Tax=Mycetomoellerius zeteki TaxID=64791 RepID=UPI00084E8021|nr:PREDICTED: uncharacterized protein LOC108725677 [Trachymyrmex zeteki]